MFDESLLAPHPRLQTVLTEYLQRGLGDGVGLERTLEVLGTRRLVLLGCLLLGQGLAVEREGALL